MSATLAEFDFAPSTGMGTHVYACGLVPVSPTSFVVKSQESFDNQAVNVGPAFQLTLTLTQPTVTDGLLMVNAVVDMGRVFGIGHIVTATYGGVSVPVFGFQLQSVTNKEGHIFALVLLGDGSGFTGSDLVLDFSGVANGVGCTVGVDAVFFDGVDQSSDVTSPVDVGTANTYTSPLSLDPGVFDIAVAGAAVARTNSGVTAAVTSTGTDWTQADNTPTAPDGRASEAWYGATVPPSATVPDIVGDSTAAAEAAIIAAGYVVGAIGTEPDNDVPEGQVLSQFPLAGTIAAPGTPVSFVVAVVDDTLVPDVIGLTLADAEIKIRAAHFAVGPVTITTEPIGPLGLTVAQSPPGNTRALPGSPVLVTVTSLFKPFDVHATVISQYQASPTIVRLVENMADYVDPRANIEAFYNLVWNVDTAVGFGLDIWGNIVGVSRLLRLPSTDPVFGFQNADDPPDWFPMSEGIFFPGTAASQAYLLPDDAFRVLILTKALSNIVATNAPSLNQLLRNLFPGRGRAYVQDLGGMAMRFVFEFSLTSTEFAILTQSGALPHPAGVAYSVIVVPGGTFGFEEAGDALPFDDGVFYNP